jgi:GAF domain-containing protein
MSLAASLEMAFPGSIAVGRKKIRHFEKVLAEEGILPALGFLNSRVRHRFTAVSRIESTTLHDLFVFDREDSKTLFGGTSQPLVETYGSLVQRRKQPFQTDNSLQDGRLLFHSARVTVLSYIGVPIRLESGELWGVLSHSDREAHVATVGESELLQEVIPPLARWLVMGDMRGERWQVSGGW